MTCGRAHRLVERAFLGELSARRRSALTAHLATCARCRDVHDRLSTVERVLGASPDVAAPLSRTAAAAIEAAVLDGVVAVDRPGRRRVLWAGGGALVAAAAVLLVLLWPREDAGLRPRGGGLEGRTPGVRVFCVDPRAPDGVVVAEGMVISSTRLAPAIRCTIGHELQLAYTTPEEEGLTMVAFARSHESILLYAPPPGEVESVALAAGRVDEPLAWSTRLAVRHAPGRYELVVRFFAGPVAVDAAVSGAAAPRLELRGTLEVTP